MVQQILHQVVTPGHNTINPYRITRNSDSTNLTDPGDVEKWYQIKTIKEFLHICIDLENEKLTLQFSYINTMRQVEIELAHSVKLSKV